MVLLAKMFDDLLAQVGFSNADQRDPGRGNPITHFADSFEICVFFLISDCVFLKKETKVTAELQQWKISTSYATGGYSVVHLVDPTGICG